MTKTNEGEPRAKVMYVHWIPPETAAVLPAALEPAGISLVSVEKTACQTLTATDTTAVYAAPEIWSGMCNRQGSWYRASERNGQTLLVSAAPLPGGLGRFLVATLEATDFQPAELPDREALRRLVNGPEYQGRKAPGWEDRTVKDALVFKLFFTLTGFWGWGDNLDTRWLDHRANHANFLSRRYTAEVDGEAVPYSVTNNDGVCSSCAEFFDVVGPGERKMVRACPGSVVFAKLERETYYDVVPLRRGRRGPAIGLGG